MLKDAIERIEQIAHKASGNELVKSEVNGRHFLGTTEVKRAECLPLPPTVSGSTLELISTVLRKRIDDKVPEAGQCIIHVVSPIRVDAFTAANADGKRYVFAQANSREPTFGRFMLQEEMMVFLQTCFEASPELAVVIETVGNVAGEQVVVDTDDGVTQMVETKGGVKSTTLRAVKNPVRLKPYATFREVPQVEEDFVFRIQGGEGKKPTFALIRGESGAAELERKRLVAEHLRGILPDDFKDCVVY